MSSIEQLSELYISLSGIIGSGKSTLAKELASVINVPVYHESAQDSPILAKFYEDQAAHAFTLQFDLLQRRVKQQQAIAWSGSGCVQDRTIYEDSVFVRMLNKAKLISDDQVHVYNECFDVMSKSMVRPNVIVHLDVSPAEALVRITERGRGIENAITLEYLTNLEEAYEEFLARIHHSIPVIRIKWETFEEVETVAYRIAEAIAQQNHITRIEFP